jgi:hypothetical protein
MMMFDLKSLLLYTWMHGFIFGLMVAVALAAVMRFGGLL